MPSWLIPTAARPPAEEKNDVITGFAIHPQHKNGNLLSESTGFARTFKVDKHDAAYSFAPEEIQAAPTDNFLFEEIHRMRLVTLKGVEVKRTTNTAPTARSIPTTTLCRSTARRV